MRKAAKRKIVLLCLFLALALICTQAIRGFYFFARGITALIQDYPGQSVGWLEKSIKVNPYFLEAYICLAAAYAEWESASVHYIEHDKESRARLKAETLGRAEELLRTAQRRFPYHVLRDDIQYMLGWIYDCDERNYGYIPDMEKAIEAYEGLIRRYPKSSYVKRARERIRYLER